MSCLCDEWEIIKDARLSDACPLSRWGRCTSNRASLNSRQVFSFETPYILIPRLSRGCHWSLGHAISLVFQLRAIRTRKRHLFWQRHLCDSLSIYFSTPVNNYDRLHLLLAPVLTFLFDHTVSIKNSTCYVSQTNGFEIRPSPCQRTIGWPYHSRFTSAGTHIWSETAVRPQTGHASIVARRWFFSGVWKAFCLCLPSNSRTNCIIERREIVQRARC